MFESIEMSALLISIIAGLFLGVPSGPALFFVLDTCLVKGKAAAMKVYGGFMAAKLIYVALALLANDFISAHPTVESGLYLAASFLLVVWGIIIMFKSNKPADTSTKQADDASLFRTGFIVGLSNPVIPFVYLTFIQFIKIYARDVTLFKYLLNITIMEAVSFLVLAGAAWLLLSGGEMVKTHWNKLVKVMALFLICAGSYQVYQLLDYDKGEVHLNSEENPLEEQLEKVEEETKPKTARQ